MFDYRVQDRRRQDIADRHRWQSRSHDVIEPGICLGPRRWAGGWYNVDHVLPAVRFESRLAAFFFGRNFSYRIARMVAVYELDHTIHSPAVLSGAPG